MAHNRSVKLIFSILMFASIPVWISVFDKPQQVSAGTETVEAANAPADIQDPLIQKAWDYLDTLEDPVMLWDGSTLTGKSLAQFLRASQIPVVWDEEGVCRGSSCSLQYCDSSGACGYEDGKPGIDLIYLNPGARDQKVGQIARVAAELAHEIFHRTQPFGEVKISQFEEYWAFNIQTQIVKSSWPDFKGYDPMDVNSLQQWFSMHMMAGYLKLDPYPRGFTPKQE
jgi:hypothetical protein